MREQQRRRVMERGLRKGGTLVLVAVLIVVTGGMAAFAVDFARAYSGINELQTGADAAALAGAMNLQRRPAQNPTPATQLFAGSNQAFGTPMTLQPGDVEVGFWDPAGAGTFTSGVALSAANAVRVSASRSTTLGFGRLLGLASLTPTRRAIAWIANQSTRDCIKPWGFDQGFLTSTLGFSVSTQAGVEALRTLVSTEAGQLSATIVAGPNQSGPLAGNAPQTVFRALTSTTSSRKVYADAVRGRNCDGSTDYAIGGSELQYQPGNGGGDIPQATGDNVYKNLPPGQQDSLPPVCARNVANANDATCLNPVTGEAGITVTVAAVTDVVGNSSAVNLNVFLQFRVMCVFMGARQGQGWRNGTASIDENCPWLARAGRTSNNYLQGTLVGFPMVNVAAVGGGNALGNTVGTSQKLVLVK